MSGTRTCDFWVAALAPRWNRDLQILASLLRLGLDRVRRSRFALAALLLLSAGRSADAQNLLSNPGFDTDLSGWTVSPASTTASHDTNDHENSVGSGSARVANTRADATGLGGFLFQCLSVSAAKTYRARGWTFLPSGQATTGKASIYGIYYSGDTGCSSLSNAVGEFESPFVITLGSWQPLRLGGLSPPAGVSNILVSAHASKTVAGGSFEALFDDMLFDEELFTDVQAGMTGVDFSGVDWGDYDNDGDLDALVTGRDTPTTTKTSVYRNDGGGTFVDAAVVLAGGLRGAHWGDYDNDQDLDILLSASSDASSVTSAKLYRNTGGAFQEVVGALAGVRPYAMAWGDYDNDGDLDIALIGTDEFQTKISRIHRNDGSGVFTVALVELVGLSLGDVAWGDLDGDDDLDLLVTGEGDARTTKIYRNDGSGSFSDTSAALEQVGFSSVDLGDYDADGDLDIALAGRNATGTLVTKVYKNNGAFSFTDISAALPQVSDGDVAWGDADLDGDLDLLVSGNTDGQTVSKVFLRAGDAFTESAIELPPISVGSVAWGDYDHDNDPDLLLSGSSPGDLVTAPVAAVFRNNASILNDVPAAPSGLSALLSGNSVLLNWAAGSDSETPAAGLTYNVRVGTAPGAADVVSPMANASTGFRRVARPGNAQHGTSGRLVGLTPGTYYWSVQSIDSAFVGSPFAGERSFAIATPTPTVTATPTASATAVPSMAAHPPGRTGPGAATLLVLLVTALCLRARNRKRPAMG